jgi:type I restriction enzyme S subunit
MNGSKGTKMPRGDKNQLMEFTLTDLNKSDQEKIADLLSSIDKKIELNNRINTELEAMAKALYDYWFVQFDFPDTNGKPYKSSGGKMVYNPALKREIPKGWKDCKLEKIIKIYDSRRIPLSARAREKMKGQFPYYGATSIMDYINDYIFDGEYVLLAEDGSVMDSDGFPVLQYIFGKTWVNNHAHVLEASSGFSNPLLHLCLKKIPVVNMMSGSIQKKINQDNLRKTPILHPPAYLLKAINPIVNSIYSKLIATQKENNCLANLRDWLLPILMNGQITVK